MRINLNQLIAGGAGIIVPWGIVTISTINTWPERLHETLIGAAICISVSVVVSMVVGHIAVGNRYYYRRDFDAFRIELDNAIKAGRFGKLLDQAGIPYRPAVPDGHVTSVPVTGENAIVGARDGTVIDLDVVRDTIRNSHP